MDTDNIIPFMVGTVPTFRELTVNVALQEIEQHEMLSRQARRANPKPPKAISDKALQGLYAALKRYSNLTHVLDVFTLLVNLSHDNNLVLGCTADKLTKKINTSEENIMRCLDWLETNHYLKRFPQPSPDVDIYALNSMDVWGDHEQLILSAVFHYTRKET